MLMADMAFLVLQYRIADKQALDLFNLHTFHWRVKPSCECQVSPSGNGDLSLLLLFFFCYKGVKVAAFPGPVLFTIKPLLS